MTYSKAIQELCIAIGYAIDASNEDRTKEYRKEAKESALSILLKVSGASPFEQDPIVIKASDIKPVRINTNR